MPSNRFDQAKPFATLGIVVLGWLLLPVFVKVFLRVGFFELQAPVHATTSYVRDLQEYWADRAHSNNELVEAGRQLRHVYAGYEYQAQQMEAQRAEIARLEQLLRLPSNPDYRFEPARVTARSVVAWLYLTLFGSLIGFTAYVWLLKATTTVRASTYAYVNPIVAVCLGWALAGEQITARSLFAATAIILAVVIIVTQSAEAPSEV